MSTALVIIVVLFFASVTDAEPTCLSGWLSKYSDSDPFLAWNKASPWEISPELLKSAARLKIEGTVSGEIKLYDRGRQVSPNEAFDIYSSVSPPDPRDIDFLKSLAKFMSDSPANTLRISYVGLYHSIDLFLNHSEINAAYAMKPIALNEKVITDGKRLMLDALRMKSRFPTTVNEMSAFLFTLPYTTVASIAHRLGALELASHTLVPQPIPESSFVLAEWHLGTNSKWIEDFPTSDCIQSIGFKKIELALEGYRSTSEITLDRVLSDQTYSNLFQEVSRLSGKSVNQVAEKFPEAFRVALQTGQIQNNPSLVSLIRKLITYRDSGIQVKVLGLERPDYVPSQDNLGIEPSR